MLENIQEAKLLQPIASRATDIKAAAGRCAQVAYQSIKIYFLSNRNITVYTVYASAQKAAREAYAH